MTGDAGWMSVTTTFSPTRAPPTDASALICRCPVPGQPMSGGGHTSTRMSSVDREPPVVWLHFRDLNRDFTHALARAEPDQSVGLSSARGRGTAYGDMAGRAVGDQRESAILVNPDGVRRGVRVGRSRLEKMTGWVDETRLAVGLREQAGGVGGGSLRGVVRTGASGRSDHDQSHGGRDLGGVCRPEQHAPIMYDANWDRDETHSSAATRASARALDPRSLRSGSPEGRRATLRTQPR